MLYEFFVFGGFWFFVLVAVEIVALFIATDRDNGVAAWLSLFGFCVLLQLFGDVSLLDILRHHPVRILLIVIGYFALGVVWAVFKWRLFVGDRLEEYQELRAKFLRTHQRPTSADRMPDDLRDDWRERLLRHQHSTGKDLSAAPLVYAHKAAILRWMSLWITSLLWSFFSDFTRRVCRELFRRVSSYMQGVADRIWANSTISSDLTADSAEEHQQ